MGGDKTAESRNFHDGITISRICAAALGVWRGHRTVSANNHLAGAGQEKESYLYVAIRLLFTGEQGRGREGCARLTKRRRTALRRLDAALQKIRYNAVPPPTRGSSSADAGAVYLDGRKISETVMRHIGRGGDRPLEGAAYFDATWNSPASDLSLSYG